LIERLNEINFIELEMRSNFSTLNNTLNNTLEQMCKKFKGFNYKLRLILHMQAKL